MHRNETRELAQCIDREIWQEKKCGCNWYCLHFNSICLSRQLHWLKLGTFWRISHRSYLATRPNNIPERSVSKKYETLSRASNLTLCETYDPRARWSRCRKWSQPKVNLPNIQRYGFWVLTSIEENNICLESCCDVITGWMWVTRDLQRGWQDTQCFEYKVV